MPRNQRCILPGEAYHITQRGTNRQRVFFKDADRSAYLRLLAHNLGDAGVRVLAWAAAVTRQFRERGLKELPSETTCA